MIERDLAKLLTAYYGYLDLFLATFLEFCLELVEIFYGIERAVLSVLAAFKKSMLLQVFIELRFFKTFLCAG